MGFLQDLLDASPVCSHSQIQLFLDVLVKEILGPEGHSPDGVRTHFITMYLDELSKVGGREVRGSVGLAGLWPYIEPVQDMGLLRKQAAGSPRQMTAWCEPARCTTGR